ncbi:MAG: ferritin-like domain-containing protein [Pyrinomonadaceae bacterium]
MAIKTLQEKFKHGLGDIYDAEHQFLKAMQTMLPEANAPDVKALLTEHIAQTAEQITVLEQVFEVLGEEPERIKCVGAAGIVTENENTLSEVSGTPALVDLAIAGGSAKVEHYEIATYRTLIIGAKQMGQTEIAGLLQKNLQQEELTAQKIEQSAPVLFEKAMSRAASN